MYVGTSPVRLQTKGSCVVFWPRAGTSYLGCWVRFRAGSLALVGAREGGNQYMRNIDVPLSLYLPLLSTLKKITGKISSGEA